MWPTYFIGVVRNHVSLGSPNHNLHTRSYRGILCMYLWYSKKKGVNVGNPWHKNTVLESVLCCTTGRCWPKVPAFGCRGDMSPTCHQHVANIPSQAWCHLSKSKSSLSYKDKLHKSARHTTKHKRGVNADRKQYKQIKYLKDVQVCNVKSTRRVQYMSLDYTRKNIVVCNGGDTTSDTIKNTSSLNSVHYLWIHDGDLWVADTANASIGLRFILPGESSPVFICLPRDESLGIMNNGQRMCKAMQSCASTQCQ